MCGIAGFIDSQINYDLLAIRNAMGNAMITRGPDYQGTWSDNKYGINLIHRRLSILDLSDAGNQPMSSQNRRYNIIFNGEIYNYKSIQNSLEQKYGPINWQGHSDTEILLMAFEKYGIEETLCLLEGMFAIAVWDKEKETLSLIRDRMGEKPLYYGYFNGVFGFASELKAFKPHPKFNAEINLDAIGQFLLHNCIPTPLSIFKDIYKLPAGNYLKLNYKEFVNKYLPEPIAYWKLSDHLICNNQISEADAITSLDKLLKDVISQQIISDVPVGCLLSGGVDSSTIAAIMQSVSSKSIKTFSIGFNNKLYNEAEEAKKIAEYLGTDHTELYITDHDALKAIPSMGAIYDEPFSDSSQIPTFLVSKLAKSKVTVALTGDAGDELFAGYNRYLKAEVLNRFVNNTPNFVKLGIKKLLPLINISSLCKIAQLLGLNLNNIQDKFYKLDHILDAKNREDIYLFLTGHWINFDKIIQGNLSQQKSLWLRNDINDNITNILFMQYLDAMGYLADDILVKVDRASMANSLETRVPFLNHKIIEFAFSLPESYKIKNKTSKWILRQVLYNYIPQNMLDRPKSGFAIPLNDWLRKELKDWAMDTLDPKVLSSQGYFNVDIIKKKLDDHMLGKANNGYYLWDILMFQQWLNNWF